MLTLAEALLALVLVFLLFVRCLYGQTRRHAASPVHEIEKHLPSQQSGVKLSDRLLKHEIKEAGVYQEIEPAQVQQERKSKTRSYEMVDPAELRREQHATEGGSEPARSLHEYPMLQELGQDEQEHRSSAFGHLLERQAFGSLGNSDLTLNRIDREGARGLGEPVPEITTGKSEEDVIPDAGMKSGLRQRRSQCMKEQARERHDTNIEEITPSRGDVSTACLGAFRHHSSDLITVLQNPEVLAWQLYSHGVVSNTVVDEVCLPNLAPVYRKARLLTAVRDQIVVDSTSFGSLLLVLKMQPYLASIAQRLEQTYLGEW